MFIYKEKNGVGYYYSTLLVSLHGFSTRKGGVSTDPALKGLNLAFGRGDGDAAVLENLRCFALAVGVMPDRVISLPQVHGNSVLHVTAADAGKGYTRPACSSADAYVTEDEGVTLGVKSADCVPVLLEARGKDGSVLAVAAVHAGWRGTAGRIVPNAVKALQALHPESEIFAAIGPCIGACCFEVGRDCVDVFEQSLGAELVESCFFKTGDEKYYGDLTRVNRLLLRKVGVADERIDSAQICTCCHPEIFFSHRYATKYTAGRRGTMLSVICKRRSEFDGSR